jgi:hypothetical protein
MGHKKHRELENVRLKIVGRGAVQGVGYRPFVYRLATKSECSHSAIFMAGWLLIFYLQRIAVPSSARRMPFKIFDNIY